MIFLLKKIKIGNRFERIWKIAQVDFKSRFYNDRLGLVWALLNPILRMLIYFFIFTFVLKKVSDDIENYAVFLFAGLIFWMAFIEMLKKGMKTLFQKRYLIFNIKVNKEDLYISSSLSILIAFLFNIVAYLIMSFIFGTHFTAKILFLPILITNTFLLGSGIGMILSIIYVHVRDIGHIVDLLIKLGFWTSGIFFKPELILEKAPILFYLNPFVGIIDNVRRVSLYNESPNIVTMNLNMIIGIIVFMIGFNMITRFSQTAMEKL